jgi:hypothetical protein
VQVSQLIEDTPSGFVEEDDSSIINGENAHQYVENKVI